MTSLFISYSRKDIESARKLTEAFKGQNLDFWIDWEGIPPTVDWWKEIERGIEEAGIFLFLISPDSAKSKVCKQEIEHAIKNGKRLIPVIVRDIKADETPAELGHLNWIFLRENDDFDSAFTKLITAITTDFEWVQAHRQLQIKALEWERGNYENSFLLRGKELQDAELEIFKNSSKEPHPTDLQREYALKSRQVSDKQRRNTTTIAIAGVIALAMLAVYGFVQAGLATKNAVEANKQAATAQAASTLAFNNAATAEANANIALARQLAAQAISLQQNDLQLSLLLGVEAYNTADTTQTRSTLLSNVNKHSRLLGFLGTQGDSTDGASVSISPDGKVVAAAGVDHSIVLWSMEDQQPIGKPLIGHTWIITSLAFNPDGKILASAGQDDMIILWDTTTHEQINQLFSDYRIIDSLAFSPDGKFLAAGGNDGLIALWNIDTGELVGKLQSDNYLIGPEVTFSPNGKLIASTSTSCTNDDTGTKCQSKIILWDAASYSPIADLPSNVARLWDISFSPDSKSLAAGGENGVVIWDISSDNFTMKLIDQTEVQSLSFSPDGNILATGGQSITLWDLNSQEKIGQPLVGHSSIITSLKFSPDGKKLASGGCNFNAITKIELCDKGEVMLWSIENSSPIISPIFFKNSQSVYEIATSPSGDLLLINDHGNMIIWDVVLKKKIGQLTKCSDDQSSGRLIAFSPNGDYIARQCQSNEAIYVWDTSTSQVVNEISIDEVTNIAFSPNNDLLAIRQQDQIILWDLSTNKPNNSALSVESDKWNYLVAFSPDRKTIAASSCNADQPDIGCEPKILLWDVASSQLLHELTVEGRAGMIHAFAFSPDGNVLASGGGGNGVQGGDSSIIIWDLATGNPIGRPLKPLQGIIFDLTSLSFSPDNKMLASSDFSNGIILWDVATHQVINQFQSEIAFVTFSASGKNLLVDIYGTVSLWDMNPATWSDISCERAGRNLSAEEWMQYFTNTEYRATCPQWPLAP